MTFLPLTPAQTYIVSIAPNEEIIAALFSFIKERGIQSGYFTGIGAVKSARLGHYRVSHKKYTERNIKKPMEIANLTGIITKDKIHAHITLGNQLFKAYAGHLVRATVSAACEVIVVAAKEEIARAYSKEIGLELLDLS